MLLGLTRLAVIVYALCVGCTDPLVLELPSAPEGAKSVLLALRPEGELELYAPGEGSPFLVAPRSEVGRPGWSTSPRRGRRCSSSWTRTSG